MPLKRTQRSQNLTWRELYTAAMLEGDRQKMPSLIMEAERAIVRRAHELFHLSGDHIEEEESLDDALYALSALKTCLAHATVAEAA